MSENEIKALAEPAENIIIARLERFDAYLLDRLFNSDK